MFLFMSMDFLLKARAEGKSLKLNIMEKGFVWVDDQFYASNCISTITLNFYDQCYGFEIIAEECVTFALHNC